MSGLSVDAGELRERLEVLALRETAPGVWAWEPVRWTWGKVTVDGKSNLFSAVGIGARNAALAVAQGDYLQFSDSDDLLTPDATETLVRAAQVTGADLVISHFFRVDKEKQAQRGHIKGERLLTRQEFAQEMVKAPANYYYGALWNKLYRRSIVEKQGLRFEEGVSWSEDFLFNLEYLRHVRLVAAVPKPLYYYHKRPGSLITSQATLRKVIRMKRDTFDYYKNLYQDLDLYDEQKARVYRYLISTATDGTTLTLPGRGEKNRRVRESAD